MISKEKQFVILDNVGVIHNYGETNYKAWKTFYDDCNIFADNFQEFRQRMVSVGVRCKKNGEL